MPRHLRLPAVLPGLAGLVLLTTALSGCSSDDAPDAEPTAPASTRADSPGAGDRAAADALASYAEELLAAWESAPEGREFEVLGEVSTRDRGAPLVVRRKQAGRPGPTRMLRVRACAESDDTALERRFVFQVTDRRGYYESPDREVDHC